MITQNIVHSNKGILGAFRHRQGFSGLHRSKSESAICVPHGEDVADHVCSDVVNPTPVVNRVNNNNDRKALKIPILNLPAERPSGSQTAPTPLMTSRPKSWSPNDKVAHFLMEQAERLSKSAISSGTEQNNAGDNGSLQVIDPDCGCFDQLSMQIGVNELIPPSPVNSVCNVIGKKISSLLNVG